MRINLAKSKKKNPNKIVYKHTSASTLLQQRQRKKGHNFFVFPIKRLQNEFCVSMKRKLYFSLNVTSGAKILWNKATIY